MPHSISEIAEQLRKKLISPVEITKQCLSRIEELNPVLNAFITVTAEAALADAREAEKEIDRGSWRGPLHGIPIGIKDIIDTAGVRTTAASALFRDRIPARDAEVVRRLRNAGAIIVGKQNMHEFAYGGSSAVSFFGPVKNPRDQKRIAGGSSGGSAAAVATGLCYASIGTDTAGSVREPAALCGVVGFKPTYGSVSTEGVIPLSPSLDHVGPITRSTEDAAAIMDVIADRSYTTALGTLPGAIRVGVPRDFFFADIDPEVASSIEDALRVFRTIVTEVKDVELEVPVDRTLQMAESYTCHAAYVACSPELYQPETLRRIRNGESISASEVEQKRRELNEIRAQTGEMFKDVDVLLVPTTPIAAPDLSELQADPDLLRPMELVLLRNTRPANVWGLPAISIPCGFTRSGLPIGLQIIGRAGEDVTVLRLATAYERLRS